MSFSAEWLALREPADHRARNAEIAAMLARRFAGSSDLGIVDLGCGTGSNLRAASALLGPVQNWTLVDYDEKLLLAARSRISDWADSVVEADERLTILKGPRRLSITFRRADLVHDLESALGPTPDVVTASALFDLCSVAFIDRFAEGVTKRGATFYTVLTYNGEQTWSPTHAADEAARQAFNAHQRTDKGFGVSAGPDAPAALAEAFTRRHYKVSEGQSPWQLEGRHDAALVNSLANGFADAVLETGRVPADDMAGWRSVVRRGAVVGHVDTLAVPAG